MLSWYVICMYVSYAWIHAISFMMVAVPPVSSTTSTWIFVPAAMVVLLPVSRIVSR